jgi:hypothetical protein
MLNTFGVPVESDVTATTSAAVALAANANRIGGLIQNNGAVNVYISLTVTAVTTKRFVLAPGGVFSLAGIQSAVNVLAASSTAALYCLELVA